MSLVSPWRDGTGLSGARRDVNSSAVSGVGIGSRGRQVMGFPCQTIVMLRSWVGVDMSEISEFRYSVSGFLMLEGWGREWFLRRTEDA